MERVFLILVMSLFVSLLQAQTNKERFQYTLYGNDDNFVIDGRLDEPFWNKCEVAKDFWEKYPRDDVRANLDTEVRLSFNEQYLIVGFTCYDSLSNHVLITQRRDESFWMSDGVALILDPIDEASSGFFFAVNTDGAQTDALLSGGTGEDQYNDKWDNKWFAETAQHDGYWTVEMAIPFKTLRYDPKKTSWGINLVRSDAKNNRLHIWAQMPRQFWPIDLGYAARLHWAEPVPKAKGNVSLIPYVSVAHEEDPENNLSANQIFRTGADAKVALSPSLNLDLTVNPDFSQVEVDQQVTNLTRFSIFFPERRNFFLENSDIFSSFGNPLVQPFFSRRIGLGDNGRPVPIQFGVRLSGNLNQNLRLGILDVHTSANGDQPAQNYFMTAFSQRVLKRSSINGFVINRQGFQGSKTIQNNFGRNAGLEMRYLSSGGKWNAWAVGHVSHQPKISEENFYSNIGASYVGKTFNSTIAFLNIGTNYYADVGFINRNFQINSETQEQIRQGYHFLYFPIGANIVPKRDHPIQVVMMEAENYLVFDPGFRQIEVGTNFRNSVTFQNSSGFTVNTELSKVRLQYPFSFTNEVPLPTGIYTHFNYGVEYLSDQRKLFNFTLGAKTGGFYNGKIKGVTTLISYRRQPWGLLSLQGEYNHIRFPAQYGQSKLWLLGPRLEIAFTRNLFWNTFVQYNTQAENFNVNSRLQWQFKPLSWIYLVYTDNYQTTVWNRKNRAIVFKVNYWLTV